mmetsp:Transcript_68927/g.215367  ORF Transcript_68927/g.215367 Transcript_68927/m.215367 type:complete len:297 (-) Transcript_68927:24-914(-)
MERPPGRAGGEDEGEGHGLRAHAGEPAQGGHRARGVPAAVHGAPAAYQPGRAEDDVSAQGLDRVRLRALEDRGEGPQAHDAGQVPLEDDHGPAGLDKGQSPHLPAQDPILDRRTARGLQPELPKQHGRFERRVGRGQVQGAPGVAARHGRGGRTRPGEALRARTPKLSRAETGRQPRASDLCALARLAWSSGGCSQDSPMAEAGVRPPGVSNDALKRLHSEPSQEVARPRAVRPSAEVPASLPRQSVDVSGVAVLLAPRAQGCHEAVAFLPGMAVCSRSPPPAVVICCFGDRPLEG